MNYEIEPYKSTYPLAYYEIGTVYSFYGRRETVGNIALDTYVKNFAYLLDQLEKEERTAAIKSVGARGNKESSMIRFYGVVIEKTNGVSPTITVMILNRKNGHKIYQTKSYTVGRNTANAITTDGKNLMTATVRADIKINGNIFSENVTGSVTGITRANTIKSNPTVTGVTRATSNVETQTKGVSGVTRAHKESENIDHTISDVPDVTGITRANTVSGVTRANSVSGITRANNSVTGITRANK